MTMSVSNWGCTKAARDVAQAPGVQSELSLNLSYHNPETMLVTIYP